MAHCRRSNDVAEPVAAFAVSLFAAALGHRASVAIPAARAMTARPSPSARNTAR